MLARLGERGIDPLERRTHSAVNVREQSARGSLILGLAEQPTRRPSHCFWRLFRHFVVSYCRNPHLNGYFSRHRGTSVIVQCSIQVVPRPAGML